jgi:hypothetical protein
VESVESGEPSCYVRIEGGTKAEYCNRRDLRRQPNDKAEAQPPAKQKP